MKFGLFYQAQLPKPLDSDTWYPGQEAKLFHQTLDEIELADKVGFDHVWLAEHHYCSEYNHMSATSVMLGAIAVRTKSIRLGPGIVQMMPGNNHPVKVAENMATIDILSNGRLEFGVGSGQPVEQDAFMPALPDIAKAGKTHDVLWEALGETLRMMMMTPYPGYQGEFITLPAGNIVPKPVQTPHPPLWLAVTSDRSLKLAAERGMGALCLAQGGPDMVQSRVEGYWQYIRQTLNPVGVAINPTICSFSHAMIAATDEQARSRESGGAAFANYSMRRAHDLTRTVGHIHREHAQGGVAFETKNTVDTPEQREHMERLAKQGALAVAPEAPGSIVGSPTTARQRLLDFEATGVDVMSFSLQVGTRRHEDIMETIEHFGRLMPEFKERHEKGRKAREERIERLKVTAKAA